MRNKYNIILTIFIISYSCTNIDNTTYKEETKAPNLNRVDYKQLIVDLGDKKPDLNIDTAKITNELINNIEQQYGTNIDSFLFDFFKSYNLDTLKLIPETLKKINRRYGFARNIFDQLPHHFQDFTLTFSNFINDMEHGSKRYKLYLKIKENTDLLTIDFKEFTKKLKVYSNENVGVLYYFLLDNQIIIEHELGSYYNFRRDILEKKNRQIIYKRIISNGYSKKSVGSFEEFEDFLLKSINGKASISFIAILTPLYYNTTNNNTSKDKRFNISNLITIDIPTSLELRGNSSLTIEVARNLSETLLTKENIKLDKPEFIFQPSGTDDLNKSALSKYSRVLIDLKPLTSDINMSFKNAFNSKSYRKIYEQEFKDNLLSHMRNVDISLLEWKPIEVLEINGIPMLKFSLSRQLIENSPIQVEILKFKQSGYDFEITLSYRINESVIWKDDFKNIIDSIFPITN